MAARPTSSVFFRLRGRLVSGVKLAAGMENEKGGHEQHGAVEAEEPSRRPPLSREALAVVSSCPHTRKPLWVTKMGSSAAQATTARAPSTLMRDSCSRQ